MTRQLSNNRRIPGAFSGIRNIKRKNLLWDGFPASTWRRKCSDTQARPYQIYNLSDAQLEAVKKKLIELKPNIRKYWSTGGELTNLFQNHEIIAAMGWPLMTNQLRKLGFPIGEIIPKENTTGWIDHLMITSASRNKDLATDFLAYMIEAKTQKLVSDVTGYSPRIPYPPIS
jgi:putative spermidine/putrescine transport system substrate-binding protein/spermidine/putrescine transport system substrate-binding protein